MEKIFHRRSFDSRMRTTKRNFQGILLFLIISIKLVSLTSCGDRPKDNAEDQVDPAVPVRIQELRFEPLELSIKTSGVMKSRYQVPISPEIAGRVIEKVREIGDPILRDEAVIILDPEPYEIALTQAEAGFESAQVAYDQSKRDFHRAEELRKSDDISQYELETAQLAERTAQANLKMAEAALKLAQRNLRLTHWTSPVDGVVAQLNADIGQQVSPGLPLGLVVATDHLEVEVGLSEKEIIHIKPGMKALIRTDAYPDMTFNAVVKHVGSAGLELSRTFPVLISTDNAANKLKPGMIVSLEILYARFDRDIIIPCRSLVLNEKAPTVYVAEGDIARKRTISLGSGNSEKVVVTSGLSVGEKLIIEGQNVLTDSVKVNIL